MYFKDKVIYLVLEHFESDLYTLIKSKTLLEPHISFIFKQLLTVVNDLHSIGLCHRDLKPGNIMFTSAGVLKLIDFGLCRQLVYA